jgi:hypothetical protein
MGQLKFLSPGNTGSSPAAGVQILSVHVVARAEEERRHFGEKGMASEVPVPRHMSQLERPVLHQSLGATMSSQEPCPALGGVCDRGGASRSLQELISRHASYYHKNATSDPTCFTGKGLA